MLNITRNLVLDIFDYDNHKLCSLYDQTSDSSGQAYDVFVTTERNGWKELNFSIPATITTENGEEDNYRLSFIKADYRIRLIDDKGTDWFLATSPTITHSCKNKTCSVVAGHISQLLKTKNLNLEFSDEEGNNIGTAEELLDTILEGTGWTKGNVETFYEKDNTTIKKRSLKAGLKTGAFKLISSMCNLFEAKPIYNGDTKTVDILHMNPFSEPKDGGLPDVSSADRVIELAYSNNVSNVSRKLNSENLVTKLYAYGAYGNVDTGYCGIDEINHDEHIYTTIIPLSAGSTYNFSYIDDSGITVYRNFTPSINYQIGTKITYSLMDPSSMMYAWVQNGSSIDSGSAYFVNEGAVGISIGNNSSSNHKKEQVRNWFSFLMDFTYYHTCGLFTDTHLRALGLYQRKAASYYNDIHHMSLIMSSSISDLNKTIGVVNFCKLDIASFNSNGGYVKLRLNKTTNHPDGVIYRTDYTVNKKNYFKWNTTAEIKTNGDPKTTGASMIYVVHNTNPVTWDKAYLKAVDDEKDPEYLTFHMEYKGSSQFDLSSDKFFLFESNSLNGNLGSYEISDEAIVQSLASKLKVVTVEHPVYYAEIGATNPSIVPRSDSTKPDDSPDWYKIENYGWLWKYSTSGAPSEFYFCYYDEGDRDWKKVYFQNNEPSSGTNGEYWFDWKSRKLYRRVSGVWTWLDTDPEKKVASDFTTVYSRSRQRDMLYQGNSKYYTYTQTDGTLPCGNYYIEDEYDHIFAFSTNDVLTSGDKLSYDTEDAWVELTKNNSMQPITEIEMESGNIDNSGYLVEDTMKCRSSDYITVSSGADYTFTGLSSAYPITIHFYDSNYIWQYCTPGYSGFDGTFNIPSNIAYIKLSCDVTCQTFNTFTSFRILSGILKTISVTGYTFDNVEYHADNSYDKLAESGTINSMGSEEEDDTKCRTVGYIKLYPNNTYEITNCPNYLSIHFYNYKKTWQSYGTYAMSNNKITFSTDGTTYYIKICASEPYNIFNERTNFSITNVDKNNVIVIKDINYMKLQSVPSGEKRGIIPWVKKFADSADSAYLTNYDNLIATQNALVNLENQFSETIGDMYREGSWQKDDYVDGDEQKLYDDALENLTKISKPEASYSINYLDLYGSDTDDLYNVSDKTFSTKWPDLSIASAAHLIDNEIGINCWAYIDKIQKCYDKPWKTTISINTNLTTISQHSFSDVLSNIANIASQAKANDSIYSRAKQIGTNGKMATDRLQGSIDAAKTSILGGSSTWYTDEAGNIIFESADGLSAMTLSGGGFCIANSKDKWGNWEWRTFGTGSGFTAEEITTGFLSAERIQAGTIEADKLSPAAGEELVITANPTITNLDTRLTIAEGEIESKITQTGSFVFIQLTDPVSDYSNLFAYKKKDIIYRNGHTYECLVDMADAHEFDSSEWKQTTDVKSGDYWVKSDGLNKIWDSMKNNNTWEKLQSLYDWRSILGLQQTYCRAGSIEDGSWVEVSNTDVITHESSRITQNVNKIEAEVARATNTEETLSSRITQTADNIHLGVLSAGRLTTENSHIDINSNKIDIDSSGEVNINGSTLNVKSNGNINVSGGTLNVAMDKIIVNGTTGTMQNVVDNLVKTTYSQYAVNTSSSSAPSSGWSTTMPSRTASQYVWHRTATQMGDSSITYSTPVCISIGIDGRNGTDGTNGTNGKGISSIASRYKLTTNTTKPTGGTTETGWNNGGNYQDPTSVNRFLWKIDRTVWVNPSSTTYSDWILVCVYGQTGATGATGATGPTGATGRGLESISDQYALVNESITSASYINPSDWKDSVPTYVAGKMYWVRSKLKWINDPTPTYTTPVIDYGTNEAISKAYGAQTIANNIVTNGLNWGGVNGVTVNSSGVTLGSQKALTIAADGRITIASNAAGDSNAVVMDASGISIGSSGKLTINTSNFSIDANGNVKIAGDLNYRDGQGINYPIVISNNKPDRKYETDGAVWIQPTGKKRVEYDITLRGMTDNDIMNGGYQGLSISGSTISVYDKNAPIEYSITFPYRIKNNSIDGNKTTITATITGVNEDGGAISVSGFHLLTQSEGLRGNRDPITINISCSGRANWIGHETVAGIHFSVSTNGGNGYQNVCFANGDILLEAIAHVTGTRRWELANIYTFNG